MAQPPSIYKSGDLRYTWNFVNSSLKTLAQKLCPYLKDIDCGGLYKYYTEVEISSSQILNSFTTPILLLPENAPNEYYDFKLYIETIGGTTNYSNGNTSYISYRNKIINTYEKGLFEKPHIISCSSQAMGFGGLNSPHLSIGAAFPPSADALYFGVNTANPTGGNRSAKAKIWYNIIKL